MGRRRCLCVLVAVVLLAGLLLSETGAAEVELRPGTPLQDGAQNLLPGTPGSGYAIPCASDWNGDGKKDLLVGYQSAGKIALYLNTATDANPRFSGFSNLRTGSGAEIQHTSGGCGAPAPWVCDFDEDGRRDLLVGAGSDGNVWLYRNTGTDAAPVLAAGVQLRTGTGLVSVSQRATPYLCDWDGDGLQDLLCGAGDGSVYFFRQAGTSQAPVFAPAVKLKAGATDLALGIRSVARWIDWNGDGLKDLVCSSDSGVYWCRNTNPNGTPVLAARQTLCAPKADGTSPPINTGGRMRLDLTDWNNDGVTDLILGNLNGTVSLFEGYHLRFRAIEKPKLGELVLRWESAPFKRYQIWSGTSVEGITNLAVTNCVSMGNTTTWTNYSSTTQEFYRVQARP
jgi:hypothetical protein